MSHLQHVFNELRLNLGPKLINIESRILFDYLQDLHYCWKIECFGRFYILFKILNNTIERGMPIRTLSSIIFFIRFLFDNLREKEFVSLLQSGLLIDVLMREDLVTVERW